MMRKKQLFAALLAGTMSLGMLTACGSSKTTNGSASTGGESTADTPVTISVLAGISTTDTGIDEMIDELLAEKYPNVTLEWEVVDWGNDFQSKMQVYMQSGLPDLLIGKAQDVYTYGQLGVLGDMTGQPYMDEVMDAAKEGVTIDGKQYGMSVNALYQGVYYSRVLFDELGLEVPQTLEDLDNVVSVLTENGITPFATHMVDTWSIGNVTMQFAMNEVFNHDSSWGDKFRAEDVSYVTDEGQIQAYENNKYLYDNTWSAETFSMEQTACDAKMVLGDAGMKVSGSWSIQNFLDIDDSFDFGLFPYPNTTGDAKLLFEPNLTFMKSADSEYQDVLDDILTILANEKEFLQAYYDMSKTSPLIKDVSTTFENPSQSDIDSYAAAGMIADVNIGNNQLKWGGFQEENAKDIAEYMQGKITLEQALAAADARRAQSAV